MAMNRKMTIAEKEARDYAQKQMEQTERRENIVFTEEQKEQVLEYAVMTGDDYHIRKLVRALADAVCSLDEEKMDAILWEAREEIDGFPDRSVGMAELMGYGYTADDMFPLRQEMALELHRVGEKVYCLQSDGSRGDYVSREMILEHEGLYGIEKDVWQRMQEQEDEIDLEEAGLYQPPMTDLDRNEALRMFDAGETVYLVTTYPRPIAVRERMEIERGPEHYQMEREDEFMNLNFIERQGYQVKKEGKGQTVRRRIYICCCSDKRDYYEAKMRTEHPEYILEQSLEGSDLMIVCGAVTEKMLQEMDEAAGRKIRTVYDGKKQADYREALLSNQKSVETRAKNKAFQRER